MNILITGSAGFIGFHLSLRLLKNKKNIFGIDNINNYYDVDLKKNRNKILKKYNNYIYKNIDLKEFKKLNNFVKKNKIKIIIHLAAQAGVRYSIENPKAYLENNIVGFYNISEVAKENKIKHFMFASTSSVYGNQNKFPILENYNTNEPQSFYAATKKSNEVTAYANSNIFKIPTTCLRFFTVFGPYGRPDMSLFLFVNKILNNKPINVFNNGNHIRDFTYIDDATFMVEKLIQKSPKTVVPYQVFNITNSKPVPLSQFIKAIKDQLTDKIKINYLKIQKGDVVKTHGSNFKIKKVIKVPHPTSIEKGVKNFIKWYKEYYIKK